MLYLKKEKNIAVDNAQAQEYETRPERRDKWTRAHKLDRENIVKDEFVRRTQTNLRRINNNIITTI